MFNHILFPIELTREARKAIQLTADMVKTHHSKLTILSVVETKDDSVMSSEEQVEKLLQEAKSFFGNQGITATTIERKGLPAFTICDVADEVNADLIIMGCRGLGLIDEEAAADSVTNRVINLASCPVLVTT